MKVYVLVRDYFDAIPDEPEIEAAYTDKDEAIKALEALKAQGRYGVGYRIVSTTLKEASNGE